MKKLLIVEDEASARKGIEQLFLSSSLPLQIETASDGYEGYEKTLHFSPDIIISDIKMPKWSGITMMEHLREKGISSKVILLTGFAEFEYAQKAIHFGVSDYILKPIVPSDLLDKVTALLKEINAARPAADSSAPMDKKLYLLSEEDQPDFLQKLLVHSYTDYFLAVIYLEKEKHLPQEVRDLLYQTEQAHIVTLADRHYRGVIIGFRNHRIQKSIISRLSGLMKGFSHLTCIYTLKKVAQEIAWLDEFSLLMNSVIWSITLESSFFEFHEEMQKEPDQISDSGIDRKKLQRLYYARNYHACLEYLQNLLYQMQQKHCHPEQILQVISSGILNVFSEQQYLKTIQQLSQARTVHEIIACLNDYFEIGMNKQTDQRYSRLVQSAIHFIQDSYNEPISLNNAADQLSITPQYLSKIFMQETSHTFVDYLTQVRIEKAKNMLTGTNLQINVISSKVGYSDPKYFCTIFKKQTGLTPNQYRKTISSE